MYSIYYTSTVQQMRSLSFPSCFTIADVVLLEASLMQLHDRPKSSELRGGENKVSVNDF